MEIAPPDADARLAYGAHPSQFVDFRRPATAGPQPLQDWQTETETES